MYGSLAGRIFKQMHKQIMNFSTGWLQIFLQFLSCHPFTHGHYVDYLLLLSDNFAFTVSTECHILKSHYPHYMFKYVLIISEFVFPFFLKCLHYAYVPSIIFWISFWISSSLLRQVSSSSHSLIQLSLPFWSINISLHLECF